MANLQDENTGLINTIDDYVDTEVASIKTKTDLILSAVRKDFVFSAPKTAGTYDIFTVTGTVRVKLYAVCIADLTSAGGCNLKVDCGALSVIADTDVTTIDTGEIWFAAAPTTSVAALNPEEATFGASPVKEFLIANSQNITMTVEALKQIDSGSLSFYLTYEPLSADGAVVAAA